jgi:hypothetical protein
MNLVDDERASCLWQKLELLLWRNFYFYSTNESSNKQVLAGIDEGTSLLFE